MATFESTVHSLRLALSVGIKPNDICATSVGETASDMCTPEDLPLTHDQIRILTDATEAVVTFALVQIPDNPTPMDCTPIESCIISSKPVPLAKYIYDIYLRLFLDYIEFGVWRSGDLMV